MHSKIHKEKYQGRLVISLVNCQTRRTSQYFHHCLQSHVQTLKSHVKDSSDFIKNVFTTDKIAPGNILANMDVCSLYTSIPNNNKGLKKVETTLKRKNLP